MNRTVLAATAALALILGSAPTSIGAATCSGFFDVEDTDLFCTATQWLKNRQITLGCGTGTTYCPNDNVTRGSMALFLNRTGIVLTPRLVGRQEVVGATNLTPGQFTPICAGTALPAVNYFQTARARGTINVPATGPQLAMFLVMTLAGSPYVSMNSITNTVINPNGTQLLTWSSNTVSVPPGQTAGFAIGISNPAVAGTLNVGQGVCALEVDVVNANPTSAPFDD
jgi:hypothetical protein